MGSECYVTCMLDSNEIRADERNVVNLTESTDNTRMVRRSVKRVGCSWR